MISLIGSSMTKRKQLSIIVPSYNDARIQRAITSIRQFDDMDAVRVLVIDGGSCEVVLDVIRGELTPEDMLISEPDNGIFDALNKGLDNCDTEYIGWLGSDDLFTGCVRASDVLQSLRQADLLIYDLWYFWGKRITRAIHGFPSRIGLARIGLHNPHFATFGSAGLLRSERFDLTLRGSDIDYFLKLFARKPRVVAVGKVAVLSEEGGFSNKSALEILRTNLELCRVYARHSGWLLAPLAVLIKLGYKSLSKGYCKVLARSARIPTESGLSSAASGLRDW